MVQIKNQEILTLYEAQQMVDRWIKDQGVRYFNELTNLGILMEEVGELSRLMVRQYGEQSFKESDKGHSLSDEMADVLWVLLCLANQTGVNLTQALQNNIRKKTKRDGKRHLENKKLKP
ncbi:MAG: pyrophosphatase [Niastella sp. SCN 39-18]|nr:nucleotide pyrophosphohydrolase [Sphingobacteriales bacterium]ODT54583.1 MAG: pyrophosphatase [Niastella sp. SCN 39-18]OJW11376.1 MAG: pyrophosphatase [Sphingobacteriales bacterium 39-19]